MIHATETDVCVLAIVTANILSECKIWLAFGYGSSFQYISTNYIATHMNEQSS